MSLLDRRTGFAAVTVGTTRTGDLDRVVTSREVRALAPGDVLVRGSLNLDSLQANAALLAFRPEEGTVFPVSVPPRARGVEWIRDNRGWL